MFGVQRFPPRLLVTIEVTLARVVDLRSELVHLALGIVIEDLVGDWRADETATPSQLLGHRLINSGFNGALCPSTIEQNSTNLVVFVDNVNSKQSLRLVNID